MILIHVLLNIIFNIDILYKYMILKYNNLYDLIKKCN